MYKIIIPAFMVPLLALGISFFLATDGIYNQNDNYAFFSYNLIAAILGTLLALLMGAWAHSKFWDYGMNDKS